MPNTTIHIDFELTGSDIDFFRERLKSAQKKFGSSGEDKIINGAEALIKRIESGKFPDFIAPRLARLREMLAMLKDRDWRLEGEDRQHVLNALSYFADPKDLVPDSIPGIGLLDDAIMIDLSVIELAPELGGYAEFCANRDELQRGMPDAEPLSVARDILQNRMRRQRRRSVRLGDWG
ncbi:DUF1232 domain-containing protein [Hyphomonas sp.]|uniref:YkvA family protein n=1 Tax=Hyphomonas sp. TaxID=87 RepID=UPI003919ADC2